MSKQTYSNRTGMTKDEEARTTSAVRDALVNGLVTSTVQVKGVLRVDIRDGAYISFRTEGQAAHWLAAMTGECVLEGMTVKKATGTRDGATVSRKALDVDDDARNAVRLYGHPYHAALVLRRQLATYPDNFRLSHVIAKLEEWHTWPSDTLPLAPSGERVLPDTEAIEILARQVTDVVPEIMQAMAQWIEDNSLRLVKTNDGSKFYAKQGDIHKALHYRPTYHYQKGRQLGVPLYDEHGIPTSYRGRDTLSLKSLTVVVSA